MGRECDHDVDFRGFGHVGHGYDFDGAEWTHHVYSLMKLDALTAVEYKQVEDVGGATGRVELFVTVEEFA